MTAAADDAEPTGRVGALILAAGSATRFGSTKQLATLRGRPLVAHAVAAAHQAGLRPVLLVVGHEAAAVTAAAGEGGPVEVVANPAHASGQSTSLRAGIAAAAAAGLEGVVVLLADEPEVPVAAITAVASRLSEGAPVVRTRYDDDVGHPVGFHRSWYARLHEVRGDRGARELLTAATVVHVPLAGPRPRDVDWPQDLVGDTDS